MNLKIYAPNLHFFAFQLLEEDSHRLWNHYENKIRPSFSLGALEKKADIPLDRKAYLYLESPNLVFQDLQGILPENATPEKTLPKQSITGLACPLLLYDSYGLALNLRIPEKQPNNQPTEPVDLDIFAQFNPEQIFDPTQVNSNLGQTILLTAWLMQPEQHQRENWLKIAEQILKNFLGDQTVPPLYQSGQLFGSPIYEYGSPQSVNGREEIVHYLIWLFIDETADHCLGECYLDLIDLWFYRHKITTAYRYSRLEFHGLKYTYDTIRQNVRKIHQDLPDFDNNSQLSPKNLIDLKQRLKTLPKQDLDYTDNLTRFKNRALTVEINTHDYQVKLAQIAAKTSPHDVTILSVLGEKIAVTFQQQIVNDLGYFDQGSQLVDKAIHTIRGIVEIDQAERDRALEHHIQAVGVGIATGAIAASASSVMFEPWHPPRTDNWWRVHPFLIVLFVSSVLAIASWQVAAKVIGRRP